MISVAAVRDAGSHSDPRQEVCHGRLPTSVVTCFCSRIPRARLLMAPPPRGSCVVADASDRRTELTRTRSNLDAAGPGRFGVAGTSWGAT